MIITHIRTAVVGVIVGAAVPEVKVPNEPKRFVEVIMATSPPKKTTV